MCSQNFYHLYNLFLFRTNVLYDPTTVKNRCSVLLIINKLYSIIIYGKNLKVGSRFRFHAGLTCFRLFRTLLLLC